MRSVFTLPVARPGGMLNGIHKWSSLCWGVWITFQIASVITALTAIDVFENTYVSTGNDASLWSFMPSIPVTALVQVNSITRQPQLQVIIVSWAVTVWMVWFKRSNTQPSMSVVGGHSHGVSAGASIKHMSTKREKFQIYWWCYGWPGSFPWTT